MAMTDNKARRLTVVRTSSDALRLGAGELVHVGVDVHKATDHVAVSSGPRGLLATWVQPARPEPLIERPRPIPKPVAQVVSEAGPTGFGLARRLRAEGFSAAVIAPSQRLTPVGPEAKCDLAPRVRQSGETRREGGLLKSGNARLRTALVEAAWR
jgi:transposase